MKMETIENVVKKSQEELTNKGNTDFEITMPNLSSEDKYPTSCRHYIIGKKQAYGILELNPKNNAKSSKTEFRQPDGTAVEGITYTAENSIHEDGYTTRRVHLLWASGRDQWIAITYREFLEGYEHGRALYLDEYSGPFDLNESACEKILEAYAIQKENLKLENVAKTSPGELAKAGINNSASQTL